jgi:hypothetical protein
LTHNIRIQHLHHRCGVFTLATYPLPDFEVHQQPQSIAVPAAPRSVFIGHARD